MGKKSGQLADRVVNGEIAVSELSDKQLTDVQRKIANRSDDIAHCLQWQRQQALSKLSLSLKDEICRRAQTATPGIKLDESSPPEDIDSGDVIYFGPRSQLTPILVQDRPKILATA